MTDAELVARLRASSRHPMMDNNCKVDVFLVNDAADRIEALTNKLAKAVEVIEWALISWDDHNKHGYNMQGDWVFDARATLAQIKGESHE